MNRIVDEPRGNAVPYVVDVDRHRPTTSRRSSGRDLESARVAWVIKGVVRNGDFLSVPDERLASLELLERHVDTVGPKRSKRRLDSIALDDRLDIAIRAA